MDTLTLFSKNLNQRSLTPRWPLTPRLLRSHVWLYPRIIVSKSHDNTSMYVDTVINFANYHIHTYTYVHTTYRMSDHIVSYWTQFRRDKKQKSEKKSMFLIILSGNTPLGCKTCQNTVVTLVAPLANSENYIRAYKAGWGRCCENVSGKWNFEVVLSFKAIYSFILCQNSFTIFF